MSVLDARSPLGSGETAEGECMLSAWLPVVVVELEQGEDLSGDGEPPSRGAGAATAPLRCFSAQRFSCLLRLEATLNRRPQRSH